MVWSEAANLRHTPELLWLLYHVALTSNNHAKARAAAACSVLDACCIGV